MCQRIKVRASRADIFCAMSALIDQEALLERVAGDPDFLATMVDIFVADAPTRLEAIRAGVRQSDPEVVEKAAHSLKGALATMAATTAAEEAYRLEQLGRSGTLEGAYELLTALERQVEEVTIALKALVEQTTPPDAA
jgi:HPt (histidine-containing phosphotransfer) domain-containing protein